MHDSSVPRIASASLFYEPCIQFQDTPTMATEPWLGCRLDTQFEVYASTLFDLAHYLVKCSNFMRTSICGKRQHFDLAVNCSPPINIATVATPITFLESPPLSASKWWSTDHSDAQSTLFRTHDIIFAHWKMPKTWENHP